MFAFPPLDPIKLVLLNAAPSMPPDIWWVTGLVFLILLLTAGIDAFTATIPDGLIFFGLLAITGMQGFYGSWTLAAHHLGEGMAAGFIIWTINEIWFRITRADALGMGDAKWTMLATACFGWRPALYAWTIGAFVALLWLGAARLCGTRLSRVTFGPFLLIGLCASLYWLCFYLTNI